MNNGQQRMWQAILATGHPLPAAVLTAAIRHTLTTTTDVGHTDAADLRRSLIPRRGVPLTDAARLAGWPHDDPPLTSAYLRHPDQPTDALPGLLAAVSDETRALVAGDSDDPHLLTLLGAHLSPRCAHALTGNRHTPSPVRVAALRQMIATNDSFTRMRIEGLDAPDAIALADCTPELEPLTWLITCHALPPAVHSRLADVILAEIGTRGPWVHSEHPIAAAIDVLGDRATSGTRGILQQLADRLTAAGVHVADRRAATLLEPRAPGTFPWRRTPLAERSWGSLLRRLPTDGEAAAGLTVLLDEQLGTDVDAWNAFAALSDGHTGTLGDLLTAATAIAAPAATDPPPGDR